MKGACKRQFESVDCSRGAPMGRVWYGEPEDCADRSIALFRVNLYSDYDDGGAYWGGGPGVLPLYCARDREDTYRGFVRARSRDHAAAALRIPEGKLIAKARAVKL